MSTKDLFPSFQIRQKLNQIVATILHKTNATFETQTPDLKAFIVPQKAEEEAEKAKQEEEKRKKKEEERARRRARGLEDEEEEEEEEKKEGEDGEDEQKEGEETAEEQHHDPGEIIKGFYYGKKDKFWVSMVGVYLFTCKELIEVLQCTCSSQSESKSQSFLFELLITLND